MLKFLLWCILLILCWPLALLALVLYPFVWLLTLPFRLVGIAVGGVFDCFAPSSHFRREFSADLVTPEVRRESVIAVS